MIRKKAIVVIPARYSSTRFPGKPIAEILGRPLIWWVWKAAKKSRLKDDVIIATDDGRIKEIVERFGGVAMLTLKEHPSGTDRVAEVASLIEGDFFINVQGDEPLIDPIWIDLLINALIKKEAPIVTLATEKNIAEEWFSPNIVKVVTDKKGFALYFSRATIPYFHPSRRAKLSFLKHVGIYGYDKKTLLRFVTLKKGILEEREGLEQLRALEEGIPIKVIRVKGEIQAVDTPDDIKKVEILLKNRNKIFPNSRYE